MNQKILQSFRYLLLALFSGLILINAIELFQDLTKSARVRRVIPFIFLGNKFTGLDRFIPNEKYVGYYVDGDPTDAKIVEEYSQAQFVLAPLILDLNNTSHRFTIFNCSSDTVAFQKMQELKLRPVKRNNLGIILAQKY